MSKENVEIVRRIYEAWNSSPKSVNDITITRADILGLELFDPSFELHQITFSRRENPDPDPDSAMVFRGTMGCCRPFSSCSAVCAT